jgi:hypothetical protein
VPAVVMTLRDRVHPEPAELLSFLTEAVKIGTPSLRWPFPYLTRLVQLPFLIRVGFPSLEREIPKAKATYEELLQSSDARVREKAQFLLRFCDESASAETK